MKKARWYVVNRIGQATLCHDEEDARSVAADCFVQWPQHGPYVECQMADIRQVQQETRDKCAQIVRDAARNGLCCADSEALADLVAGISRRDGE